MYSVIRLAAMYDVIRLGAQTGRMLRDVKTYFTTTPETNGPVRVPLRLAGGECLVTIELPPQVSEVAWQQMMAMLSALKPGYVSDPNPDVIY